MPPPTRPSCAHPWPRWGWGCTLTLVSSRRCGRRRPWPPSPRPSSPLPGPETAVFGCSAPCAPIQKCHTEPIYYGKRLGRLHGPWPPLVKTWSGLTGPLLRTPVALRFGRRGQRGRRIAAPEGQGARMETQRPDAEGTRRANNQKEASTLAAGLRAAGRRASIPRRAVRRKHRRKSCPPGGKHLAHARDNSAVNTRQTTIYVSATSRARRRLPGETHRRRGIERGEKVLARAAARPRGHGQGHRGPGHGQHGGLLNHAYSVPNRPK